VLDEVTKLIHACGDAFRLGPSAIAEFYWEPCVTVRAGVVRVNQTREDTERLFTEVAESYRARGFTYGEPLAIDVQPLGVNSALATVQWAYNGACAELLWTTTFSYNLHRRGGAWKILVQTMHDS
jgi:hypothetical protein